MVEIKNVFIVLYVIVLGGLLAFGVAKNIWTQSAINFFIGLLAAGVIFFAIQAVVN